MQSLSISKYTKGVHKWSSRAQTSHNYLYRWNVVEEDTTSRERRVHDMHFSVKRMINVDGKKPIGRTKVALQINNKKCKAQSL